MNKAVMLSIQPKWCELIAIGKKTIEVRKTRPSIETPFKCYIYCTKGRDLLRAVNVAIVKRNGTHESRTTCKIYNESYVTNKVLNGRVIGEFVCDYIDEYKYSMANYGGLDIDCQQLDDTCLTKQQVEEYANGKHLYGWHISDLVIYDKPRELGEFKRGCNDSYDPMYGSYCADCDKKCRITRPPQSWMYVEEV